MLITWALCVYVCVCGCGGVTLVPKNDKTLFRKECWGKGGKFYIYTHTHTFKFKN